MDEKQTNDEKLAIATVDDINDEIGERMKNGEKKNGQIATMTQGAPPQKKQSRFQRLKQSSMYIKSKLQFKKSGDESKKRVNSVKVASQKMQN